VAIDNGTRESDRDAISRVVVWLNNMPPQSTLFFTFVYYSWANSIALGLNHIYRVLRLASSIGSGDLYVSGGIEHPADQLLLR
jgi:hypothetical protein